MRLLHAPTSVLLVAASLSSVNAAVVSLTPETWQSRVQGRSWLVYFAVQGCKHCAQLAPMMDYVSDQAPDLRVGKVDASEHNGLARTFNVKRFPTIMLFDETGIYYEFMAKRRSPPDLIKFGRGDPSLIGVGTVMPSELLPDASEWRLMAEALWPPLKVAFTWALGLALAIKGVSLCLLRLISPGHDRGKRDKGE
jgi:thiol-disulfide isomerase/thioredoxin